MWDGDAKATVTIRQDGSSVADGLTGEGEYAWSVSRNGTYALTHTTYTNGVAAKVENATFVVEGKDIPFPDGAVTVAGYAGIYDGDNHGPVVNAPGIEGLEVRWWRETIQGEGNGVAPELKDVGSLTVWCEMSAPGYITQTNSATVTITKRPVTLTSGSASKAYDGTALTKRTVSVSGSGWVAGEGAAYTYTGAQTDVGSSANTFSYALTSGTLAGNYAVTTKAGMLTVTRADAGTGGAEPGTGTVPAGGVSKFDVTAVYDGAGHTIDTNALAAAFAGAMKGPSTFRYAVGADAGTTPSAGWSDVPPAVTNAGSAFVWYKVTNPNYNDYTHAARVAVTKRPVTLTSGSASKAYDGTALTKRTVSVSGSGWVAGEGAAYTYTGAQTDVGSSANTFSYALRSGTLADNYAVTTKAGTLTVTKADAGTGGAEPGTGTVPAGGVSKFDVTAVYDGAGHTIDTNALAAAFAGAMKGPSTFRYAVGADAGTAPSAGWSDIPPAVTNAGSAFVWYKVTNPNYNDFAHAARVTVTKRPMSSVSVSNPGVVDYTGAPLTPSVAVGDGTPSIVKASDYTVSYADNIQPGTARIILTATVDGNYTGTKTIPFTVRKTTFDIDDGTGGKGGAASLYSYAGVYDGQGHGINVQIANPPSGTTIKYARVGIAGTWSTVKPLFTNVCNQAVVWYAVECAGYVSVTNSATVTISTRAVTVKSASKSKAYDGAALKLTARDVTATLTGGTAGVRTLPASESFVYGNFAERTEAGTSPATFTVAAGPGTDLANYAITTEFGTLTVAKATLDAGRVFPVLGAWTAENGFACTRVYNGKAQPFQVSVAEDFAEAYEFLYALTPGAWSPVAPTRTTVAEGPVRVYFKFLSPNFEPYEGYGTLQIIAKEITDEMVQPGEEAFFFDGDAKKPVVDVRYEVDGRDVCTTDDYTLVYGEKADAGWWVTVTGLGNYEGTVTKIVPVLKRPVTPPVYQPELSYSGSRQRPSLTDTDLYTVVSNEGGIEVGSYAFTLRLKNTVDYKWKGQGEDESEYVGQYLVKKATNLKVSTHPAMASWTNGVNAASVPKMGNTKVAGAAKAVYFRVVGASVETEVSTVPTRPGKYVARFVWPETLNYAAYSEEVSFEVFAGADVPPVGGHTVTTPEPVPYVWLDPYLAAFGGDYETAAKATGANNVALWESYVVGLDPTDPLSRFTAKIKMNANNQPIVSWNPALNGETPAGEGILKGGRVYRIYGKKNLEDTAWTPDVDPKSGKHRFYKITVELPK